MYRQSWWLEDWTRFKKTIKKMKWNFFDGKIDEITNKKCGPWELMNWVKKRSHLAIKAIQFNSWPYIELDNLWEALYKSFNSTQNYQVNISLLDEISDKETTTWAPFSKKELLNAIESCNNLLTSGLDRLSWRHFKEIIKDEEYTNKLIDIANTCINLGFWPSHFKMSSMVIISKPNRTSYNLSKSFWPIILLNTTSKLFEKMIGERLQFSSISNNFIHLCQLGRFKHKSITDMGIALTHFIRSE